MTVRSPVLATTIGCATGLASGAAFGFFAPEPDAPGPYAVQVDEYDLGAEALQPSGFPGPVEMQGVVHAPSDLDDGPFPLVVFLHGRHVTCYDPDDLGFPGPLDDGSLEWPCSFGRQPIPNHRGYDFWAERLASHGFVVVSIGANGVNAADNAVDDGGAAARARLVEAHLEQWAAWNEGASSPLGTRFAGAVDLDAVGLMGHSRGGEGMAAFVDRNADRSQPFGVRAVLLLAPTDFGRQPVNEVPLGVIVPYCDGDVFDLQGVHYFDDSRYAVAGDPAPKYLFAIAGSNHNFYNTTWSPSTFEAAAFDDFVLIEQIAGNDEACGSSSAERLSEPDQRTSLMRQGNAFFRRHLADEVEFEAMLRGDEADPGVSTSYVAPDAAAERLLVNRIDGPEDLLTNDLGQPVAGQALSTYDLCGVPTEPDAAYLHCVNDPGSLDGELFEGREPHAPGLAHLRIGFADGSNWTNALPVGTDVSQLRFLQFRAAVNFEDPNAGSDPIDFTISLVDRNGARASTRIGDWTAPLGIEPGALYPVLPKLLLRGIRIPLQAFEGIDLGDVASVEFGFDRGAGAIVLGDLAFVDAIEVDDDTTGGSTGDATGAVDGSTSGSDSQAETSGADPSTGDDTDSTSGEPSGQDRDDNDGCGCRSDAPPSWLGALLLVGFAAPRRRRVRARPVG